jgi:hypothetical protein
MSRYVIRMEQMAIGAALRGRQPPEAAYLRPEDFVYPVGRQVYADVARERENRPQATRAQFVMACAARFADQDLHINRWTLHAMTELAAAAEPGELTAVHRQLLATGVSNEIDWQLDKIRYRPGNDVAFEILARGQDRLNQAIARRTETLAWLPGGVDHLTDDMITKWDRESPYPTARAGDPRWYHHESVILAGLMQHPRSAWMLGSLIGPNSFSTALHRDTYGVIMQLAADYNPAPLPAIYVHSELQRHRSLGLAETSPNGGELAHLEGLATGAAVTPVETAAAVRELLVIDNAAARTTAPQTPTVTVELLDPPPTPVSSATPGLSWT